MSKKQEKNSKTLTPIEKNDRRSFLKKAVYAVPTIVALGALTKPIEAEAFTKPPSGPQWT